MSKATITSKGQITIPISVRRTLHLRTGDRVEFVVHGKEEAVLKPITKTVDDVFGSLHNPRGTTKSVAEMNAAIARRAKERNR